MTATAMTLDDARAEARERLPEVLADVLPDFRPEKAFRCLNPGHEDRHPSARYLSRANMVKCFSCGWTGDTFDVVGAVYGLDKSAAFKRTFELLGIDARGGGRRPRRAIAKPKANPGTWAEIVSLIYPPGWDKAEEATLPEPLQITVNAEEGLAGRLALDPESVAVCIKAGLRGWHFDDVGLGAFYDAVRRGDSLDGYAPESLEWLRARAIPEHLFRKMTLFIARNGQRRMLDGILAGAFSHFQNQEPPRDVLAGVLAKAITATGELRVIPTGLDDDALEALMANLFERLHAGEDSTRIMAEAFTRPMRTDVNSDANFLACVILLGLDRESIEERAGILEFDAGMTRSAANRQAVVLAVRDLLPGVPATLAGELFDCAAMVLDAETANGWSRTQTIGALAVLLGGI